MCQEGQVSVAFLEILEFLAQAPFIRGDGALDILQPLFKVHEGVFDRAEGGAGPVRDAAPEGVFVGGETAKALGMGRAFDPSRKTAGRQGC
jgi:hypothetical protein